MFLAYEKKKLCVFLSMHNESLYKVKVPVSCPLCCATTMQPHPVTSDESATDMLVIILIKYILSNYEENQNRARCWSVFRSTKRSPGILL